MMEQKSQKEQKTEGKKEMGRKQRGNSLHTEHKAEVYQKRKEKEKTSGCGT